MMIFNESSVLFAVISVRIMNLTEISDDNCQIWGWIIVAFIMISLAVTFIITLPPIFFMIKDQVSNLFRSNAPANKEEEKISRKPTINKEKNIKNDKVIQ